MTRLSKQAVRDAVEELERELGAPLKLEMNSPGDRHGTRYRVYADDYNTLILAVCGAGSATQILWSILRTLRYYKRLHATASDATAQLQDIEA